VLRGTDEGTAVARSGVSPIPQQQQFRSGVEAAAGAVRGTVSPYAPGRRREVGTEIMAAAASGAVVAVAVAGGVPDLLAIGALVLWCLASYHRLPHMGGPLLRQLKPLAVTASAVVALTALALATGLVTEPVQTAATLTVTCAAAAAAAVRIVRVRRAGPVRAVVVGDLMEIARWLDAWHERADVDVVGAVLVEPETDTDILPRDLLGVPVCLSLAELPGRVGDWQADLIAFAPGFGLTQADVRNASWSLKDLPVTVAVVGLFDAVAPHRVSPSVIGGETLCEIASPEQSVWKRVTDIVVSLTALIALAPVMALIALLVKLDGGPALFRQVRVSQDGQLFRMIKFRTMRPDAEAFASWTTENDPRVTRLGGFLRRTSLDELPQLFNVLRGEMSIVGPRPEQPRYVETFGSTIPQYAGRHRVKAGITGWAQVNGLRGDTSIEHRTQYDLWYTENASLALDAKIMAQTAATLFGADNAY
jgi:exopolysaccharide biosynthesis polyprenyl glycosylphosphotransferase